MFLQGPLLSVLAFGFIKSGTPLQLIQNDTITFAGTPNIVKPASPSNISINTPEGNSFTVQCDGNTYGYNPDIRDCEAAKENLMPDSRIWTLGERHTGLPSEVVPLPYRVMGDRGLCYVQPVLIGAHRTGQASINMIRQAAANIIIRCATDTSSQGGIATNIGGDNNLAVIVGTYQSPVSCQGSLASYDAWVSCREILYSMPADKTPQVFGPRGDPTVTRGLPIRINSVDSRCLANVFSTGKTEVATYYDIWEAVTAVFTVCVRRGKIGSTRGVGRDGGIFLTMTTRDTIELPSNSSEGATTS